MKKWLIPLAVAGAAAGVWYFYYNTVFQYLFLNDAMDYASIARNVARGDGFVSSYITPLGLAADPGLPHPNLWRAPLWPAALAVLIGLLGSGDQVVAIGTGLFFIAGSVMVYLTANTLFGRLVALLSALVFIFSSQNLLYSISGMTESMSVFLILAVVYLVMVPWARSWWGDLLAGAVMGLFYLTRYNALLFVPFFILLIWSVRRQETQRHRVWIGRFTVRRRSGLKAAARYLAAFGVVISPWLVRNWILVGSPFYSLQKFEPAMFTASYPGYSLYTMLEKVDTLKFMTEHPAELLAKAAAGWAEFTAGFVNSGITGVSPYLFYLFLISLCIPFGVGFTGSFRAGERKPIPYNRLKLALVACYLVQLAALLIIHFIYRLFFVFMPFYIIFAIAALVWLLDLAFRPLRSWGNTVVTLGSVLVTILFIVTNLPAWEPAKEQLIITQKEAVKAVMNMSTRDGLILSNDGHLLAWYGNRFAAKLPYRPDMIPEIEKLAPVQLIYLSSRMSWNIPEVDDDWRKLYWGKPEQIAGFKLVRTFPDGSVIYRKD